jgi:plastocyanin
MHATALALVPVLAAEKSKAPFYVAGAALVVWALIVSVGLGFRKPGFPYGAAGQRAVMAISAALVLTAASTAVITSGGTRAEASSPASSAQSALKLAADPSGTLSYDTKQLSAKAGKVTLTLTNAAPLAHNVTVARGSTVLGATPTFQGGSKTITLNLKPGTYTFFCSVPGHRQAGMEGTLTVS